MRKKKHPLVVIEWIDTAALPSHDGPWHQHDDVDNLSPVRILSVGWLMKENARFVVVLPHMSEHHGSGAMTIPKGCIIARRNLRTPQGLAVWNK